MTERPVVVGVGEQVEDVLVLAALNESAMRGTAPVRLVHVRNPIVVATGLQTVASPYTYADVEPAARAHLARTRDRLLELADAEGHPAPPAEMVYEQGDIVEALRRHASDAAVIVLGVDTVLGTMLVGRTALRLAQAAGAPVLVARGEPRQGPVVIAVPPGGLPDGGLIAAFTEADYRRCPVRAVRIVEFPAYDIELEPGLAASEEAQVAEILAGHATDWPDVKVEISIHGGNAKQVLLHQSQEAALLVLGTSARGPLVGAALGSVTVAMLHHARCPVLVLPSSAQKVSR